MRHADGVEDRPTTPSPGRSRSSLALQGGLLLALGIGIVWALLAHFGADEVRTTLLAGDRLLLGLAFLAFASQILTMGLRWWWTLRLIGIRVPLVTILRANCASNVINFVAPGHFGEPAMAIWLDKARGVRGVDAFTVLIACKVVATLMNLGLLLFCLPFLRTPATEGAMVQLGWTTAFLLGMTAVGLVVVLYPRIAYAGARLAASLVSRLLEPMGRSGDKGERWATATESLIRRFRDTFALFTSRPTVLLAAALLSATKMVTMIVVMMLIYAAFGTPLSAFAATFLETIDVLGNMVSIWIPANMGLQEAVHTAAATAGLQLEGSVAVAASLAMKVILTAHILLGGLCWLLLAPWDRPPAGKAPSVDPQAHSATVTLPQPRG